MLNKAILTENHEWGLDGEWAVIPTLRMDIMEDGFYLHFHLVCVWHCLFVMSISGLYLLGYLYTVNGVVLCVFFVVKTRSGTSLAVQWLGLGTSTAWGPRFNPWSGN